MFRRRSGSVVLGVLVVGALIAGSPAGAAERGAASAAAEPALVPVPSSLETRPNQSFLLRRDSRIVTQGDSADVARHLAQILRPSTGFDLPVTDGRPGPGTGPIRAGDIVLALARVVPRALSPARRARTVTLSAAAPRASSAACRPCASCSRRRSRATPSSPGRGPRPASRSPTGRDFRGGERTSTSRGTSSASTR